MRNDYKPVLADLQVKLKSVHAHVKGMFHCLNRILRHQAGTAPVRLDVNIIRHVNIVKPYLSLTVLYGHCDILRILARSRGEIMVIGSRELVAGSSLALVCIYGIDFLYIKRRIVNNLLHLAHRPSVLEPLDLP